jgi:3-oxoadipate enol-lactonase
MSYAVESAGGLKLNVVVEGPAGAPALMFSNSLGSDLSMWDGVVEALGPGFRTIRYDTRGHGRSAAPKGPYSVADLGRDAVRILEALGIDRAAFCGLSLGGTTGMWVGAHAPERLSHLVLANTAASFQPASMWRDRAATARKMGLGSLLAPSMERWFTAAFRDHDPETVARAAAMMAATAPEGYAGCCEALAEADLRADLSRIKLPTLVVVGEADPSTPPALGEAITAGIPEARLVSLPAAHLSALERPGEFAEALNNHLLSV